MNAPAKVAPARAKYHSIVRHHMPAAQGRELELRCSLLLMRDQATARLDRCSDEAYSILNEIQRLASLYAYRSMPTDELEHLRYQLLKLTACASGLEMFAYRLAFPEKTGGADARGG